jgi:electron transfer flavoprotein beta subunit
VDLVFTGKQTIDGDTAQVGPGIAKRLGLQPADLRERASPRSTSTAARLTVERRAEGGVQVLETTLPSPDHHARRHQRDALRRMDDMLRAGRYPVRKWNKDDAGIEDVSKIGLKGSPTIVSKVFGPTPRSQKADLQEVADSHVNDVCLNLLQKIFTTHPTLERESWSKGCRPEGARHERSPQTCAAAAPKRPPAAPAATPNCPNT